MKREDARTSVFARLCVRALIWCSVRGIYFQSFEGHRTHSAAPRTPSSHDSPPKRTHTHTAMTAIMESVDRRLINCSSIETNDGTHWRDIVIVYCLNAWSLCIMHMSMCVWRCQKREAVLFLSPPPPPAMPRVNHYGLTHFYTFDLKKKCVCESKRKHVKPCNCI